MTLTKDQLIFKALVALEEVVAASREGPVEPSASLRFVLAWLYAQSGDNDRAAYDAFWRIVTDDMDEAYSPAKANSMRGGGAMTQLSVIARRAGYELNSERQSLLWQVRMTKQERTEYRNSPSYRFANRYEDK